jgi:NADH-quinone oxidoreductase subunit N
LAGFPPTIGFMAKYYLLSNLVITKHVGLTIAAIISSVISVGYYVYPIVVMYFRPVVASAPRPITGLHVPIRILIFCAAVAVLLIGIFPSPFLDVIVRSATAL